MSKPKILFDGWPLAYHPNSPAALHLLTLLAILPDEVEAHLACPAVIFTHLPENVNVDMHPTLNTEGGHLGWEQSWLPKRAAQLGAVLLTASSGSALFSRGGVLPSPAGFGREDRPAGGLAGRVRLAAAGGGLSRAKAVLWPDDLLPGGLTNTFKLPPVVHPAFSPAEEFYPPDVPGLDLPESYVLYHGPQSFSALRKVLDTWTWAAAPIGDFYPLLIAGLGSEARAYVEHLLPGYGLQSSVRILPADLPPAWLGLLYQYCTVFFQPFEPSVWGSPIRHALACGRPVVSVEHPQTDALVGPAALLMESRDAKGLASGLISMVVKDKVAEGLQAAALARAEPWRDLGAFRSKLLVLLNSI